MDPEFRSASEEDKKYENLSNILRIKAKNKYPT